MNVLPVWYWQLIITVFNDFVEHSSRYLDLSKSCNCVVITGVYEFVKKELV